jgi:hypothetical protein
MFHYIIQIFQQGAELFSRGYTPLDAMPAVLERKKIESTKKC